MILQNFFFELKLHANAQGKKCCLNYIINLWDWTGTMLIFKIFDQNIT